MLDVFLHEPSIAGEKRQLKPVHNMMLAVLSLVYCWLPKFNSPKRLTTPGNLFRERKPEALLTWQEKGSRKIVLQLATPFLHAMQHCKCKNTNMKLQSMLQCGPTILLQMQSVLTVLNAHRVCVLWNSSLVMWLIFTCTCQSVSRHMTSQQWFPIEWEPNKI